MNTDSTNTFALLLRRRREAAGMSREALAGMLGRSLSTIWNWEHGSSSPNVDDLQRLAAVLGGTWTISHDSAAHDAALPELHDEVAR